MDPIRVILVAERRDRSGGPASWVHGLAAALTKAGVIAEVAYANDLRQLVSSASGMPAPGSSEGGGGGLILHTYSQGPGSLWLATQAQLRHVPVVHTVHGDLFAEQQTKRGIRRLLWLPFNERALAAASAVTVPSAYLAERLVQARPALAGRLTVIPNGVDVEAVASSAPLERSALGVGPSDKLVVAVTTFTHRAKAEGIITVCEAVDSMRASGRPVELRIAGEGVLRPEIQRRCGGEGIRFEGFVPDAARLIAACDVFVHSSGLDVFAYVVLEAFALSKPTVVTPVGGIAELVGEAAEQVAPGDAQGMARAIGRLLDDEDLALDLAARGATRAREFDWEWLVCNRWIPLYEEVLGCRSS